MVRPIPEGTHTVTPHLVIKGAAKAIDFYKKAFGAQERYRMSGPGGGIAHAELQIGDSPIFLADEWPQGPARSPQSLNGTPVVIQLYVEDVDALWQRALGAGAKPTQPLMDMFWGDRYGQVRDPFGHLWAMATHKEDLSPDEMARRGAEAMASMTPSKRSAPKKTAAASRPKSRSGGAQKASGSKARRRR